MNSADVCVVIPVYNGEKFILDTINSVLAQSYPNLRLVVIDDGSTDNSLAVIERSFGSDKRVCIKSQENEGLPKTITNTIMSLNSDFVMYLGQDDLFPPDHCAMMVAEINLHQTDIVFCNNYKIDENSNHSDTLSISDHEIKQILVDPFSEFIEKNFISVVGSIWSVKKFKLVGGWDITYRLFGEWLYYLKVLNADGRISYTDKSVVFYRRHSNNNSNFLSEGRQRKQYCRYSLRCRTMAFRKAKKSLNNILKFVKFTIKDLIHLSLPDFIFAILRKKK